MTFCYRAVKKRDLMISAFIPFHMFNATLLSLMLLFLYQTEQLSAVPLGGNVPLIHSPLDRELCASVRFVLVTNKKKKWTRRKNGPEKPSDHQQHLKCYITSTHLLTGALSANALAPYAATPFSRKCSSNVPRICIIIIRTCWFMNNKRL